MFEKINFGPGKVFNNDLKGISVNTSNKEWLKKVCDTQDLFMVDYPEGYVIHVGWFYKSKPENGRFTVSFFKSRNLIKENYNNNLMIKKKCCSTLKSLDKTVRKFNEIIKKRLSKDQELYNKEKPTTFKEFLKSMDMTPAMGSPLLKHLPNKKFLPLIEKEMKKDIQPHILTNLMYLLGNTHNRISEDTLRSFFEEIINTESRKIGSLDILCAHLIGYKKKDYCVYLKKILEKYGTKKYLVENTYAFLHPVIRAAGELNCVDCYEKIDEIAGYGTKMNGRVLWSAQEALKILEKEICSPKDFTLYIDSKKSLDEIKDALVKKLKARIASYHAVELDGNRIELWYDRNYDPKAKTRQSKYLVTLTRTDLSRSLDEQKKLKAELEVFFKNLGKTYLSSRLFS